MEDEIRINYLDGNCANELFQYIFLDFPEIFWCDGKVESVTYQEAEPYVVLEPDYLYDREETEQKKAEVESVTQERLGVFCTYVTGTAKGNESHAWNLIMCNGDYYYVDTTWGDPLFLRDAENGNTDNICYDYMCCSDEELFKTHVPDGNIELPACTKMDANYYVVNGMYYTEYDSESIFAVMSADISAEKEQSVFKFADSELYQQAHEDIFGNLIERAAQVLMDKYQLQQVRYRYKDDDQLNKITIYWQYE